MDIDHFKQINDLHGHDAGDKVLRMVAATLRHNLRKGDSIGRWGGEEFLAILYDLASPEALKSISEKLRTLVAFSRLDLSDKSLMVTISVGATLLFPGDTPESVVSQRRCSHVSKQTKRTESGQRGIRPWRRSGGRNFFLKEAAGDPVCGGTAGCIS
ncbi:MAG: GGDEF domain-containing protein [Deltaproteobacteria bacterium]|nr:GGDEF domain-containing protein [Deltaproteobacteria bacterium]